MTLGRKSFAMDAELKRIYYGNSPGALRGPKALLDQALEEGVAGVSLDACREFLRGEPTYTLYRPARRHYQRNHIVAEFPGAVVQMDIMDMQRFKHANTYSYVLLSYDTYSKYLMGVPLRNRKLDTVLTAIKTIVTGSPYHVKRFYYDKEGSFLSHKVQDYLKEARIKGYTTTSQVAQF